MTVMRTTSKAGLGGGSEPSPGADTLAAGVGPGAVMVLLREQALLYGRLESYARRQRSLVTGSDTEPLLSLLAERQKLAVELGRVAERLAPIRRTWATFRGRLSPAQRAEADRLVEETTLQLQRVIESDERDARLLEARKQMTADALRSARRTGDALSAYRAPERRGRQTRRLDEAS